jgi:hypothetical protein
MCVDVSLRIAIDQQVVRIIAILTSETQDVMTAFFFESHLVSHDLDILLNYEWVIEEKNIQLSFYSIETRRLGIPTYLSAEDHLGTLGSQVSPMLMFFSGSPAGIEPALHRSASILWMGAANYLALALGTNSSSFHFFSKRTKEEPREKKPS